MAWTSTAVTMVRVLIDDLTSPYSYSDARIQQLLVVAAQYVQQEIDLVNTYTITIDTPTIVPDPTVTATLDNEFTNFIVLKAACLVDQGKLRTGVSTSGLEARLGPAILKTANRIYGFQTLIQEGPCAAYQELKKTYGFSRSNLCEAILSPFISSDYSPPRR